MNTSAARTYGEGILFIKYVNGQTGKIADGADCSDHTLTSKLGGHGKEKKPTTP